MSELDEHKRRLRETLDALIWAEDTTVRSMHAKTVEDAWKIARQETEAYQRRANRARTIGERALCLAARDASSRIALRIRYGRKGPK